MKEQEFILPEYWYIEINDENRDLLIKWRKETFNLDDDISKYKYINKLGRACGGVSVLLLLSTEQFKTHVLKLNSLPTIPTIEDYTYSIELFKKLNIQ